MPGLSPTNSNLGYRLYAANGKIGIWRTGAKRNRFPRGEAVERSETDEERRYEPISYSVRKKGTALNAVCSYLPVSYIRKCRRSSSAPAGHLPPGGRNLPAKLKAPYLLF